MRKAEFVGNMEFLKELEDLLKDLEIPKTVEDIANEKIEELLDESNPKGEEESESNKLETTDLVQLLTYLKRVEKDENWINKDKSILVEKEDGVIRLLFEKPIEELVIRFEEGTAKDELEFEKVEQKEAKQPVSTIACIIGCSSSGKDKILKEMLRRYPITLSGLVSHTTRPMREGEVEGREYYFISPKEFDDKLKAGEFVEHRVYNVEGGETWNYGLSKEEVDMEKDDIYVGIFDVDGYFSLVEEYGKENVFPIYVDCDVVVRLERALSRENIAVGSKKYREVLRRFYADSEDIEQYKDGFETIIDNGDCSEAEFRGRVDYLVNRIVDHHCGKRNK